MKPALKKTSRVVSEAAAEPERGVVVVGASAGAIDALTQILPRLPRGYSRAVLVVVHMPPDKESILAKLFAQRCSLPVKEAEDKETIVDGTIYFAPPNYHLQVEPNFELSLSNDEPVLFSRPSIDVLFETASDSFGSNVTGVVLTGASADGADGLKTICAAGGQALVQLPNTAEASAMPKAAALACPKARLLTLPEIAEALRKLPN